MIGTDTWYPPPSESQLGFSDLAVDDSFYDKLLGYGKVQKKSPTVNLFNLDGMSCVSATAVLCVLLDIIISISCILREHCRLYGQSATHQLVRISLYSLLEAVRSRYCRPNYCLLMLVQVHAINGLQPSYSHEIPALIHSLTASSASITLALACTQAINFMHIKL